MKILRPFTVVEAGLTTNVAEADYAAHSLTTIYILGDRVIKNHKVYESLTGSTSVVTISIATPAVIAWASHGLAANTPVAFSTTGALPTGLVAGTVYYVSATGLTAGTFQVSAAPGGAVINTTGVQSGVHTARASLNYGIDPTNVTYWLNVSATNRWKMFDQSVQSQTTNTDNIAVSILATDRIDIVALINTEAQSVRVTLTDVKDGVVYDNTTSMISVYGIGDMYAYFFEPIVYVTEVVFTDIPRYLNATLAVTILNTGFTAKCGACVLGQQLDIGDTEVGVKTGIQDYSIKQRDAFGNYTVLQRAYNKTASFTVTMDSVLVDQVQNLLAGYRSTPIVYIGSPYYGSTIVYGFYKSFDIDIGYRDGTSVCTMEVEGLT